jgi:hypothetical protein
VAWQRLPSVSARLIGAEMDRASADRHRKGNQQPELEIVLMQADR